MPSCKENFQNFVKGIICTMIYYKIVGINVRNSVSYIVYIVVVVSYMTTVWAYSVSGM